MKLFLLLTSIILFSGCLVVDQIDRYLLAKRYMQFDLNDPKIGFINEMHMIREGSAGGAGQNNMADAVAIKTSSQEFF